MIDFKRPGTGISPGEISNVIGRTLKNDIKADMPFGYDSLI